MSITYLEAIREAQARALAQDPRVFIYGQDVGAFGGAFKATKNLAKEFPGRVIDSPISEDAMVGLAIGAAIDGMRPIIEMQFADFSSVGFNQIINQAATLFWRTQVPCPIVIRLPSGGTSGSGPFHSQSMEGLYAHYPGLIVMTPASAHATNNHPGEPTNREDSADVMNIPDPIIDPMTIIVPSVRPRLRTSLFEFDVVSAMAQSLVSQSALGVNEICC